MTAPTRNVTIQLDTLAGVARAGITVKANLDINEIYDGFVIADEISGVTDASGTVVLACFPNAPSPTGLGTQGSTYRFRATIQGGRKLDVRARVPDANCFLHDILVETEAVPLTAASLAVLAAQGYAVDAGNSEDSATAAAAQTALDRIATDEDQQQVDTDRQAVEAIALQFGDLDTAVGAAAASAQAAQTARTNAETAETNAETAETNAEAAQAATEAARDMALAASRIYASTAAGLAAVASGEYFYVVAAGSDDTLELYKDNAGVAEDTGKRIKSSAVIDKALLLAGVAPAAITDTVEGSTTPNTISASASFMWTNHTARTADTLLRRLAVRVSIIGTGKILVVDRHNAVLSDTAVVTAAGVNTYDLSPGVFVPAGGRVWFLAATGLLRYVASGTSYSIAASEYTGSVGDKLVAATTQAGVNVALECTFSSLASTHEARLDSVEDGAVRQASANVASSGGAVVPYYSTEEQEGTWTIGAPSLAFFEFAQDAGTDLVVGDTVTAVSADLIAATGTDHFRVKVYERATSAGDIQVIEGTSTKLAEAVITVGDFGLTLDASVTAAVKFPLTPFKVKSGMTYHVILEAFTAAQALANFGKGNVTTASESRQRRRGWYRTAASPTINNVGATSRSSTGLILAAAALPRSVLDRVIKASVSISSMDVTVLAIFERNGVARMLHTTHTIAAATGANIRYDTIYYDADADSFGVVSGTERANDPSEFIPSIGAANRVPLYNVRATASAVTAQAVWGVYASEWRMLAAELEQERRRGRMCLRKTLAKIRRGAAIEIQGFGDSIVAFQSGAAPSNTTPNGASRDNLFYFTESIGSDVTGAIPLYTAVQLGRTNDGAGTTHHKVGFVWSLVNALDDAGYTLGTDLTYDNFGIASTTTTSAWTAGAATTWLSSAAALAPDLVVINLGMNEYGGAATEANMVSIIGTFRAAGSEVVVMAPARKTNAAAATMSQWRYTHRALHRAAVYAGAAFVPTMHLYDDDYLGVMGCTALDTCSANRINHPGIREHGILGMELTKLVMS